MVGSQYIPNQSFMEMAYWHGVNTKRGAERNVWMNGKKKKKKKKRMRIRTCWRCFAAFWKKKKKNSPMAFWPYSNMWESMIHVKKKKNRWAAHDKLIVWMLQAWERIINYLQRYGLEYKASLVGDMSIMSGKHAGVSAVANHAFYVHFSAHCLNLF